MFLSSALPMSFPRLPSRCRPALLVGALTAMLGACSTIESWSNPLIGTWQAEAPVAGFGLGQVEFSPNRMRAFGLDQDVDYRVQGNAVTVMPRGFGPQIQATMVDRDTARVGAPFLGLSLLTLYRVR